jgi:hypothetical protein
LNGLAKPWQVWEDFWHPRGPPQALGLFRVWLGLYWLVRLLPLVPHVTLVFSGDGMYFPYVDFPENGIHSFRDFLGWLTPPMPPAMAWVLFLAMLASLVLWTAGWWTKAALGVFNASFVYHYLLCFHMQNTSYDRTLFIILLILSFGPCDRAFSLDARLGRKDGASPAPLWTQRLICVQIALLYLGTGLAKLSSSTWTTGGVLYKAMQGNWATPASFWLIRQDLSPGWYDLGVVLTKLFEIYAAVFIFLPRFRPWVFAGGLFFHLSIAVLLGIWQFLFIPLTYVLFVEPQTVATFFDERLPRLRERFTRRDS